MKNGIITKKTLKERTNKLRLEDKVNIANEKTFKNSNNLKKIIGSRQAPKGLDVVKAIKSNS